MGRNLPRPSCPSHQGPAPWTLPLWLWASEPPGLVHASAKRGQFMSPTDKPQALHSQTPIRTLQSLCSQADESCVGGGNAQGPTFLSSLLRLWALGLGPAPQGLPAPAWASALLLWITLCGAHLAFTTASALRISASGVGPPTAPESRGLQVAFPASGLREPGP